MSLTINAKAYENDVARAPNIYRYLGPSNTFSVKDYVDCYRTSPKATATFAGVGKAEVKMTRGVTDGTDNVGDAIASISVSFPADAAVAELQAILDDLGAWLDGAEATELFINHAINQ